MSSEQGEHRPAGKTTLSPQVLTAIVRTATLNVPGVSGMAPVMGGSNRLFRRTQLEGVVITIHDNVVSAEIHLVLKENVNIREVGRSVQLQAARAIHEMTGMQAGRIEIHVEDIDYAGAEA
jgi:uncharacterized alkaline shock family protein YloU